jgi:hypothetical protein
MMRKSRANPGAKIMGKKFENFARSNPLAFLRGLMSRPENAQRTEEDPEIVGTLNLAAQVAEYEKRRARNTEAMRRLVEEFGDSQQPEQESKQHNQQQERETAVMNETEVQTYAGDELRVIPFPTMETNPQAAISALTAALERRTAEALGASREKLAEAHGRISKLNGVVADLTSKNLALTGQTSRLEGELRSAKAQLDEAVKQRDAANSTIVRLQEESATAVTRVREEAETKIAGLKAELQQKSKGGRRFLVTFVILAIAAAVAVMLL